MNLTDLITQLTALRDEHGDVRVLVTSGCGCCEWNEDPHPQFSPNYEHTDELARFDDQAPEPTVLLNY